MSLVNCNCCKKSVSKNAKSCPYCGEPNPSMTIDDEVKELAMGGRKIAAIKMLRNKKGLDLKGAKNIVDKLY